MNTSIKLYFLTKGTVKFLKYHNIVLCPEMTQWTLLNKKLKEIRGELTFNYFLCLPYLGITLLMLYVHVRYLRN